MSTREKRQHYVPQEYLRRFRNQNSNSKVDRVWVFDISRRSSFDVPIKTVASRDSFYDSIIDDYIKEFPERATEKLLTREEHRFFSHLKSLALYRTSSG